MDAVVGLQRSHSIPQVIQDGNGEEIRRRYLAGSALVLRAIWRIEVQDQIGHDTPGTPHQPSGSRVVCDIPRVQVLPVVR